MREKTPDLLMGTRNQLANAQNPYQGEYKRVLFLCSAGLLRSATAAHIFSAAPYNWNTRTAGVSLEYALNPVNEALLHWAEHVFVMTQTHLDILEDLFDIRFSKYQHKVEVLNIADEYEYRNPLLIAELIKAVGRCIELPSTDL